MQQEALGAASMSVSLGLNSPSQSPRPEKSQKPRDTKKHASFGETTMVPNTIKEDEEEEDEEEGLGELPKGSRRWSSTAAVGAPTETTSLMGELRRQRQNAEAERTRRASEYLPEDHKAMQDNSQQYIDFIRTVTLQGTASQRIRGREKAMRALHDLQEVQHAKSVAFALFLGLLVDGVPEGILMGFLAAEGHLTAVLIISLFVANFPEAFSSASLLIQARMPTVKIIGLWAGLCALVGVLAGLSCWVLLSTFPDYGQGNDNLPMPVKMGISLIEGITGGAMIACIASVMLPEAFERAGKTGPFWSQSGFHCLAGFLLSASLKALLG